MRIVIFILAATVALTMSSCVRIDDINVQSVENVSIEGMSKLNLTLRVENRAGSKVTIKEGRMTLNQGTEKVMELMIPSAIVVPRRSVSSVEIPIRVKLNNPLSALALLRNIEKQSNTLTVSGRFKVKAGMMSKEIVLENVPLSQIMTTFGTDIKTLFKSI